MPKLGAVKAVESPADKLAKLLGNISYGTSIDTSQVGLMGPPGAGKTTTALTVSEFFPTSYPASKAVTLEDVLVISTDRGGLDGPHQAGITVPHLDLSRLTEDDDVPGEIDKALDIAQAGVEAGKFKYIIDDSASSRSALLVAYYRKRREGYKIWDGLAQSHQKFFNRLSALDCGKVYIFHPKYINQDDDEKRRASQLAGTANIEIDIQGSAKGMYKRHISQLLLCWKDASNKKQSSYWLYPNGGLGFEGKNRFQGLDEREPANLRLLLEKIKSKQPK